MSPERRRRVGSLQLFTFMFSVAGSGPAGTEGVLSQGLTLGVLGTFIFSAVWASSLALASVEFTVRHSDSNGGLVVWCLRAGYRRLATSVCFWELAALTSVAAVVSESSATYVQTVADWNGSRFGLGLSIVATSLAANVLPVRVTTGLCALLSVLCFAAFATMAGLSLRRADWSRLKPQFPASPRFGELANSLVYSGAGVDSMAAIVESVQDARHAVPRAMAALGLSLAFNLVFLVCVYVGGAGPSSEWSSGYFSTSANRAGGQTFQRVIVAALVLSNWQTFLASMAQAAHTVAAASELGLFPAALGRKNAERAPVAAAVLSGAAAVLFLLLPFQANLSVQAVLYSLCSVVLCFCGLTIEGVTLYMPKRRSSRAALLVLPLLTAVLTVSLQTPAILGSVFSSLALCAILVAVLTPEALPVKEPQEIKL